MTSILKTATVAILCTMSCTLTAFAQSNLTELSATQAARQIRAGKLKSEDLVNALADAIEKKKDLNAFIAFDREAALKAARRADQSSRVKER